MSIADILPPVTASGHSFPRAWQGHWIGAALAPGAGGIADLGSTAPPGRFTRILLRTTFTLDEVPVQAPSRLTADSRYVLFVNGVEVGRGPIRSQPRRLSYDQYDLARFLVPGENTVAVLVSYYGEANAFWQPASGVGRLGTNAVLAFEAELGDETLTSDSGWRALAPEAWTVLPKSGLDGVPIDRVDAARIPEGWIEPGFDDADWPHADVVHTDHIGGFARSRPPTDPYGALNGRPIGMLAGATANPRSVWSSVVAVVSDIRDDRPGPLVLQALASSTEKPLPARLPTESELGEGTWQHIAVDFGRVVAGFVQFDIDAPAGTVIDLHYREFPFDPSLGEVATAPGGGMRYIAKGGGEHYEALELNGLRYLHLLARSERPGVLRVRSVAVREHHYPWEGEAAFTSSDAEVDALYLAGIRTVQLNSFDAFTDCPTREQRSWVGDGVVHQMVHFTTNSDWRLASQYLRLGDSPRPDGILPMSVAGEVEAGGAFTIPDWSLHWVHGVHNAYRYAGDGEFILSLLPTVERILRWYSDYVDEHGTISDVAEWNLVDWSSVFSTGRSSILTALWARSLREFADMSEELGNAGSARWARDAWRRAAIGFEAFWDETRGCYIDHILEGVGQPAASQAAGAAAIVSGLAPEKRWGRIAATISDVDRLVVRSWIGGEDGGYDLEKMQDQAAGIQRIDWDVETEIVRAQPFFSYIVHDAFAAAGREDLVLASMRSWTQFLHDGYDTFGECWGWGTPVHGWSATPTRDLVQYVLGVTPGEPGFGTARIAPRLGGLDHVAGVVPTPFGPLSIELGGGFLDVDSPVPCIVSLPGLNEELSIGAGVHRVAIGG